MKQQQKYDFNPEALFKYWRENIPINFKRWFRIQYILKGKRKKIFFFLFLKTNKILNEFSQAETLYVSLMCLVTSCLSSVTFEVGARSPLGHSVTKSATFNALFRRNYSN